MPNVHYCHQLLDILTNDQARGTELVCRMYKWITTKLLFMGRKGFGLSHMII